MGDVTVGFVIICCWIFADFGNVVMGAVVVPTCTSVNSVAATGVCYALAHAEDKYSWDASNRLCTDAGWSMAVVNSVEIMNLLNNAQVFSGSLGSDEYWISAYKKDISGAAYKWRPSRDLMSSGWVNWDEEEPSEQDSEKFQCVYAKHSEQHKWSDKECSDEYLVLCEKGGVDDALVRVVSVCSSNPCQNGGVCTDSSGAYTCACVGAFSGTNCEIGYQGNFTLVTGTYTFLEARSTCQATDGCTECDLADIDTDEELTRVTQLFSTFDGLQEAWIGLLRRGEYNSNNEWSWKYWTWVRDSNVVKEKYSETMSVSGDDSENEKCGRMKSTNVPGQLASDRDCGFSQYGFICEGDFPAKCDMNPCHTNSVCAQVNHRVICECPDASAACQAVNPCSTSPCLYEGICTWIGGTDYLCECAQYFSGDNCQINEKCEQLSPCVNGGTCSPDGDNYNCTCPELFSGVNCNLATVVETPSIAPVVTPLATTSSQQCVCNSIANLALNKPTSRSSQWSSNTDSAKAVDGNQDSSGSTYDSSFSCFHAATGSSVQWMAVNLEADVAICHVRVLNRDVHPYRLEGVVIGVMSVMPSNFDTVTADDLTQICTTTPSSLTVGGQWLDLTCDTCVVSGSVLVLIGSEGFTVCEVEVYGTTVVEASTIAPVVTPLATASSQQCACSGSSNLALNKPTASSSEHSVNSGSSKAVDGNLNTTLAASNPDNGCFKASSAFAQWIAVDLEADIAVCRVRILNKESNPDSLQSVMIGLTSTMPSDSTMVTLAMLTPCTITPSSLTTPSQWLDLTCDTCVVTGSVIVLLGSANLQVCELEVYGSTTSAVTTTESAPTQVTTTQAVDTTTSQAAILYSPLQTSETTSVTNTQTVCDTHENLALNKETSSLSMYTSTNPSSKAVDGDWNTDGIQGSGCFFSLRGPQWMAVDLGATYDVCQVRVLNRNEMMDRLENTEIGVMGTLPQDGESVFEDSVIPCAITPSNLTIPSQWINMTCQGGSVRGSVVVLWSSDYLHVCELQVYGSAENTESTAVSTTENVPGTVCVSETNLAYNKPTASMSAYQDIDGLSDKAVDGNTETSGTTTSGCFFSRIGPQWLAVDLGQTYDICDVRVLNRDQAMYRLESVMIGVISTMPEDGDTITADMFVDVCKTTPPILSEPSEWINMTCDSGSVRGSVLLLLGGSNMHVCELQVYGEISPPSFVQEVTTTGTMVTQGVCENSNLAFNKPTSSKSTFDSTNNPSSNAVDGDTETVGSWQSGCFFSLYTGPHQWLAVNLGEPVVICEVRVLNRAIDMGRLVDTVIGVVPAMPADGDPNLTVDTMTHICTYTPPGLTQASEWINMTCDSGCIEGSVLVLIGPAGMHVCELEVYGDECQTLEQMTYEQTTFVTTTSTAITLQETTTSLPETTVLESTTTSKTSTLLHTTTYAEETTPLGTTLQYQTIIEQITTPAPLDPTVILPPDGNQTSPTHGNQPATTDPQGAVSSPEPVTTVSPPSYGNQTAPIEPHGPVGSPEPVTTVSPPSYGNQTAPIEPNGPVGSPEPVTTLSPPSDGNQTAPIEPHGPVGSPEPVTTVSPPSDGNQTAPIEPHGPVGSPEPVTTVSPPSDGNQTAPIEPHGPVGSPEPVTTVSPQSDGNQTAPIEPHGPVGSPEPVTTLSPPSDGNQTAPIEPQGPVGSPEPVTTVSPPSDGNQTAPIEPHGPVGSPEPVTTVSPPSDGNQTAPIEPHGPVGSPEPVTTLSPPSDGNQTAPIEPQGPVGSPEPVTTVSPPSDGNQTAPIEPQGPVGSPEPAITVSRPSSSSLGQSVSTPPQVTGTSAQLTEQVTEYTLHAMENATQGTSQVMANVTQERPSNNINVTTTTTSTAAKTKTTPSTTTPAPSLKCSTPKQLPNSYVESIPLVGGYAMYQCKPGYKFPDGTQTRTLLCDRNDDNVAVWHAEITDCQAKQCPHLYPPLENAICQTDHTSSGVHMTCRCTQGLLFANGQSRAVLQCGESEVWSRHPGSCLVRCGELPMIRNSRLIYSENYNNLPGSFIEVECNIGHRFPHGEMSKQITCQHNGQWQDVNYCHVDSCPTITGLNHASLNTTITIYSTYVKVTCDEGYTIAPGQWFKVVRCEGFDVWSEEINNDCVAIECPPIPTVHSAYVTGTGIDYNSTVTFTCHPGFGLTGDILRQETGHATSQIRCQQDSNWSISALSCEYGRCVPVPDVDFAVPDKDQALQGSLVTYTCQTGYTFPSDDKTQTILCDNTQWNISHMQCVPVRCAYIDNLGNGTVPLIHDNTYLSTVEVTCNPGFTIRENSEQIAMLVQCTDTKSWKVIEVGNGTYWEVSVEDMMLPTHCSVVHCGSLPDVPNSITPVFYPNELNSNISITCKPGFWFSRGVFTQYIICGETSNWEPELEPCIQIACPQLPSWQGAKLNTSATAVGAAVNVTCSLKTVTRQQHFADATSWHETVCAPNGEWLPSVPKCIEISNLSALVSETTEAKDAQQMGMLIIAIFSLPYILMIVSDVTTSGSLVLFFLRNLYDGWLNFKELIGEPDTGENVFEDPNEVKVKKKRMKSYSYRKRPGGLNSNHTFKITLDDIVE